jgi:predicted transcriptional regulator
MIEDEKWKAAISFLKKVGRAPDKFPDKLAVFVLTDEELYQIFTKERFRILKALKEKRFPSITMLSDFLGRDKAAVDRDLKILEEYGLIKRVKKGNRVVPVLDKEGVYLPLGPTPIERLEVAAK